MINIAQLTEEQEKKFNPTIQRRLTEAKIQGVVGFVKELKTCAYKTYEAMLCWLKI